MSGNDSPKPLLVDLDKLLSCYGGADVAIFRRCVQAEGFITRKQIEAIFHRGLLRWPYFSLLKNGVKAPLKEVVESRKIAGQTCLGYASETGILSHLEQGYTLMLNQLEDWHRGTRDQLRSIEAVLPVEAKAFVFLSPEDNIGLPPHRDDSHVLVVQLEGRKEWRLHDPGRCTKSESGLYVDTGDPLSVEVLEPGDLLYLPYGYPHAATAVDGWSLHLTFTLTEPTPKSLTLSVLESWLGSLAGSSLLTQHHRLTVKEKVHEVAASLSKELGRLTDEDIVGLALAAMRSRKPV